MGTVYKQEYRMNIPISRVSAGNAPKSKTELVESIQ